ncbi:hypothetical protein Poli38472_002109 [Pythium oligandrum]|uniref:Tetratricopeptide repeat protein 29 n=1 Tax=Pythium oligandrum TaxID=41045 RepID=A0A8K1CHN9_PYTOL|nr:hypothetical protein Poli38472_002109 [Pythium oligandrum]|eukprot:TMW63168.1 hypothetical protein Poli38472_002109 [Pythium oligandrum]
MTLKSKDTETRRSVRTAAPAAPHVIQPACKKPVRAKPMRGPGAHLTTPGALASSTSDEMLLRMHAMAGQPPQAHAKFREEVCVQMLMGGYVQSFVDMFYLTHRPPPVDAAGTPSMGLEPAEMEFLRDQLVTAEHSKRRGEIPEVLNAFESLATYCAEKQDIKTMIFFYEKCLEIARVVKDPMCEMRVLSKIGEGFHSLLDLDKAREFLEQHVAIAQVLYEHEDDSIMRSEAFMQLAKVYWDLGFEYERRQLLDDAIDYYKKYLDCASKASELEAVGEAQLKIGMCYNLLVQPSNALPFIEAYLVSCQNSGHLEGEGKACAELATAHENLGNKQLSIEFLNRYASIAAQADNLINQADACRRLGHIYTASQNFQRAREMHEKNYELTPAVAAGTGDSTAMNSARINVGAARANDRLAVLLSLVKEDFRGLLEWKNSRIAPAVD